MVTSTAVVDLFSGGRVRDVYGDLWSVQDGRLVCLTAQRTAIPVAEAEASKFAPFTIETEG